MINFSKYFIGFLRTFFHNVGDFFKTLWEAFSNALFKDIVGYFEDLINELLKSNSPKKWFRAYFNHGLINYIYGQRRLLPCDMSFDTFFIDPYGDVMPCNGTKDKEVMGNLNNLF